MKKVAVGNPPGDLREQMRDAALRAAALVAQATGDADTVRKAKGAISGVRVHARDDERRINMGKMPAWLVDKFKGKADATKGAAVGEKAPGKAAFPGAAPPFGSKGAPAKAEPAAAPVATKKPFPGAAPPFGSNGAKPEPAAAAAPAPAGTKKPFPGAAPPFAKGANEPAPAEEKKKPAGRAFPGAAPPFGSKARKDMADKMPAWLKEKFQKNRPKADDGEKPKKLPGRAFPGAAPPFGSKKNLRADRRRGPGAGIWLVSDGDVGCEIDLNTGEIGEPQSVAALTSQYPWANAHPSPEQTEWLASLSGGEWDEELHPRGKDGKFAPKGSDEPTGRVTEGGMSDVARSLERRKMQEMLERDAATPEGADRQRIHDAMLKAGVAIGDRIRQPDLARIAQELPGSPSARELQKALLKAGVGIGDKILQPDIEKIRMALKGQTYEMPGAKRPNTVTAAEFGWGKTYDTADKAAARAREMTKDGAAASVFAAQMANGRGPDGVLNTLWHSLEDSNWHRAAETLSGMMETPPMKNLPSVDDFDHQVGVAISQALWGSKSAREPGVGEFGRPGAEAIRQAATALEDNGQKGLGRAVRGLVTAERKLVAEHKRKSLRADRRRGPGSGIWLVSDGEWACQIDLNTDQVGVIQPLTMLAEKYQWTVGCPSAVQMEALVSLVGGEWDEDLHPRADDGKFTSKGGSDNDAVGLIGRVKAAQGVARAGKKLTIEQFQDATSILPHVIADRFADPPDRDAFGDYANKRATALYNSDPAFRKMTGRGDEGRDHLYKVMPLWYEEFKQGQGRGEVADTPAGRQAMADAAAGKDAYDEWLKRKGRQPHDNEGRILKPKSLRADRRRGPGDGIWLVSDGEWGCEIDLNTGHVGAREAVATFDDRNWTKGHPSVPQMERIASLAGGGEWDEDLHPRDENGRFADKGGTETGGGENKHMGRTDINTMIHERDNLRRKVGNAEEYARRAEAGTSGMWTKEDAPKLREEAARDKQEADHLDAAIKSGREASKAKREGKAAAEAANMPKLAKPLAEHSISEMARLIGRNWKNVNYAAKPYLEALHSMEKASDPYFQDSGHEIIARFLGNANAWKGPLAKEVKDELRRRIGLKK